MLISSTTKLSIIKVGLSEVEVLGKHAVHDDILRMHIEEIHHSGRTWLFRKQLHGEEYHSRHDPMGEDSTTLYAKLHAPVNQIDNYQSSRHQLSNRQLGQVHAAPRGNEAAVPGAVGAILWRQTADNHHRRPGK